MGSWKSGMQARLVEDSCVPRSLVCLSHHGHHRAKCGTCRPCTLCCATSIATSSHTWWSGRFTPRTTRGCSCTPPSTPLPPRLHRGCICLVEGASALLGNGSFSTVLFFRFGGCDEVNSMQNSSECRLVRRVASRRRNSRRSDRQEKKRSVRGGETHVT